MRTAGGWLSCTVGYAADLASLRRELAQREPAQYPLILQERIAGDGVGLFACYDRGRPTALFCHRRLREKPPWGGVSVLSESAPLDPDAVAAGTAPARRAGLARRGDGRVQARLPATARRG